MADLRDLVPDDPMASGRWVVPGPGVDDDDDEPTPRRPGRLRRWVLRPLAWGLAVVVLLVLALELIVDTQTARSWAHAQIVERLTAATGRAVRLDAVTIDVLPFVLEVEGLEIGGGPGADGPFLSLPFGRLEANLDGLRRRRLDLRLARLEQPVIDLRFYPEGGDNLIDGGGAERAWEVWIDQAEIDGGRLLLDHGRIPLDLQASSLRTRMRGFGDARLQGEVIADAVRLTLPEAEAIHLGVVASATFEPGLMIVEEARIRGGSRDPDAPIGDTPLLDLDAEGFCEWKGGRAGQQCRFETRGSTRGEWLAELGYFRSLRGALRFDGAIDWRPASLGWSGRVSSERLDLWGRRLDDVEAEVLADRFRIRLGLEQARYAGGRLDGEVVAEPRVAGRPLSVDLTATGVRLDDLLADQQIPVDSLAARLDADVFYTFPLARSRYGDGFAEVRLRADPTADGLPIDATFPLRIADGVVQADAVAVIAERQSLLTGGEYRIPDANGRFDFEIETADLGELVPLLPTPGTPPTWLPTAGAGQLAGAFDVVRGSFACRMRVDLDDVVTPRVEIAEIRGGFDIDPAAIEDLRLDLIDRQSSLVVRGRLPFGAGETTSLELTADRWPMAKVRPWVADTVVDLPVDGEVSGRLDLDLFSAPQDAGDDTDDGASEDPADAAWQSRGRLAGRLASARVAALGRDLDLGSAILDLTWDVDHVRIEQLRLLADAGAIEGAGLVHFGTGDLDFHLRSERLDLGAEPFSPFLPRDDLGGVLSVDAQLGGQVDAPDLEIRASAERLTLAGFELAGGDTTHLTAHWDGRLLDLDASVADVVRLRGGGPLAARRVDLAFGIAVDDLGGLVRLAVDDVEGVGGATSGELRLSGIAGPTGPLHAEFGLRRLRLELPGGVLETAEPTTIRMDADAFYVDRLALRDQPGDSGISSGVEIAGSAGWGLGEPLELDVDADLDLRWLAPFLPLPSRGRVDLDGQLHGTIGAATFVGEGRLRDGAVEIPGLERGFEDLDGRVRFADDVARIDELAGRFAGGRARLAGEVGLGPLLGGDTAYRLDVEGRNLLLRYLAGFTLAGNVDVSLRSIDEGPAAGGRRLSGRVDLTRLEYLDELRFDLLEVVQGFLRGRRLDVAAGDALASTELELQVRAPDAVRLSNDQATLGGSADLVVRGNLAQPVPFGEITIDPGGQLAYSATDYTIDRGRLVFADPFRLAPEVDLVATTEVRDFDVTLALSGPLERLEARFSSEPPLPQVEVFRLLAGGDAYVDEADIVPDRTEQLGEEQGTSAATLLYGQAASAIGDRVNSLFGFDKFRIDPLTGSRGDNLSKARFTVGKRLSKDLLVTYSVNPSSNDSTRIRVEWELADGIVLVLSQNGDDSFTADARFESTF